MKVNKHRKKIAAALDVGLALSPVSEDLFAFTASSTPACVSAAKARTKKGWRTIRGGKKRYYKKGKYVTGIQKIRKKYYYFDKKGIMKTGTVYNRTAVYYLDNKGILEAFRKKSVYYYPNGKRMSTTEAQDFKTLQTAKSIAGQVTNSRMTQEQKLKACFDWVISKPYVTRRTFANVKGWPAVYANDHFLLGGGNCFSDAAAFAYLAKALGYKNVYVCVDCDGSGGRGHAWAEINGLAYDPLFAEAKSYSANYAAPYGTYILHPILHIAL